MGLHSIYLRDPWQRQITELYAMSHVCKEVGLITPHPQEEKKNYPVPKRAWAMDLLLCPILTYGLLSL